MASLKIPFYKPSLGEGEINEVLDTLRSGWLTTGPKTKQFEKEFAEFSGHKHAVALNSCTAGLHLALEAIGLKAGDGVLVPTMTFAATAEVVRYFGGRPILVDMREADFNLDVADAERRLESARAQGQPVAAIIPVHYGGQMGDVARVTNLAQKHSLKVVEDAAHCCPAFYREGTPSSATECEGGGTESGNNPHASTDFPAPSVGPSSSPNAPWLPVGTQAEIACFSFYANKCITTGEGGMACTNSDDYADRMRIMSLHGISRDAWKRFMAEGSWYYEIIAPGYKYNLTDVASAIGLHQLRRAGELHRRRCAIVAQYLSQLADLEELTLPSVQRDRIHAWHLFVIRLNLAALTISRAEFITKLGERGIGTSVHYTPLHLHPYYRQTFGYQPGDLPVASRVYPEILTLPLYPDMTEADVGYVCRSVREIIEQHRK